ncbi:MAG: hypothetical protein JXM74_08505 [Fusobacteriaceae bacterium]|nr:hypothetical protein [Fusobacteriaceae bacterium]
MELLIVIAIISTLGLLSFPMYTHFYKTTYAGSDAIKIENLLKRTRQKSLSSINDSSFGVFLNRDDAKFVFYQGSSFETREVNMDQEIIYKLSLVSPAENVDINFLSGQGFPDKEQIFLFESDNGDIISIVINKFGGIFLE